ncbi:MAG: hypothetical protein EBV53_11415 [Proteobacteria bacterium]|nr:hypothetical protein [Pseudomonadota bacterium]
MEASLVGTILTGTNLDGAILTNASMTEAIGVDLTGSVFDETTTGVDPAWPR